MLVVTFHTFHVFCYPLCFYLIYIHFLISVRRVRSTELCLLFRYKIAIMFQVDPVLRKTIYDLDIFIFEVSNYCILLLVHWMYRSTKWLFGVLITGFNDFSLPCSIKCISPDIIEWSYIHVIVKSFTFTFTGILWRAVKQHQLTGKLLWRGFRTRLLSCPYIQFKTIYSTT